MKFFSANVDNLRKLYISELQRMYSAEVQIAQALPRMIVAAIEPQLRLALETHLEQTRNHVIRVEEILSQRNGSLEPKKNKSIAALISEGQDVIEDSTDDSVRDAGIIGAAQKIEHYEIAVYGTLRTFAEILGEDAPAQSLEQMLQEEKQADAALTEIANTANMKADKEALA